ncbi:MAG TPA: gamma carbonic anhydrase family protein [Phycisphaerae bacterium]|nr:gamma carbonic anhydrase family protein [Phycisphaerae bacterium]
MQAIESKVVVGRNVFVAPGSYVGGDVALGDDCTVMYHVVIRGDVSPIRIGNRVNIQDGSILHTHAGVPLIIGDDVSIGHMVIVHCKSVGAGTLIGNGAIVLDDSEIGSQCIIAAGAVVTPKTVIPDHKVVMGVPATVVRDVTEADVEYMGLVVRSYMKLGQLHAAGRYPGFQPDRQGSVSPSSR